MILVLSPAKSLDFKSQLPTAKTTQAQFLQQAECLNKVLKKKSAKTISSLMKVSDTLGQLNYQRNQDWQLPFTKNNARQAIYAFSGDVYRGLDAYTIPKEKINVLQNKVRILSGLYGILKPLDLIQAYRLEMGTKLPVGTKKDLYQSWKKNIVETLNNELKDDEIFVNLASKEYFKAIDTKALKVPVVNIDFKEFKDGKYKIIAIYAKLARGLMARHIIDTNAKTIDDLKNFTTQGYGLSDELSSENHLVFTR